MPFIKLDDRLSEHPKILKATTADERAGWLYVCSLGYANRNRTDGFIPAAAVPLLTTAKRPQALSRALVDADLWHEVEGGYQVHDYLQHQASADQINAKLRKDSARKSGGIRAENGRN